MWEEIKTKNSGANHDLCNEYSNKPHICKPEHACIYIAL